jgi:hypothetical protein
MMIPMARPPSRDDGQLSGHWQPRLERRPSYLGHKRAAAADGKQVRTGGGQLSHVYG